MVTAFSSLRFRLTAFFGGLVLALTLGGSFLVGHLAAGYMTETSGERLQTIARSIAGTLTSSLEERTREIELLAGSPLIVSSDWNNPAVRQTMDEVTRTYRPYAWLGLADADGKVIVAANGLLEGGDVSARPWFVAGRERVFIGDVHEAVLLAKLLEPKGDEPLRFVDFAAPVRDREGRLRGVIATHLHWSWIRDVVGAALPSEARDSGVQVFVRDGKGNLLYPFHRVGELRIGDDLVPQTGSLVVRWPDERMYLVAAADVLAPTVGDLEWQVVLRQPVHAALAAVEQLQSRLMWLAVPLTLLGMALAWLIAGSFSRPVEELAEVARRIDSGDETAAFPERSPIVELRRLAASLRGMTATLLRRRAELVKANLWLEKKVEARTAELQAANDKLAALSLTDPLTGLANRRRFDEVLATEWARCCRAGIPLAVMLIDLDHFKQYNDSLGHQAGDDCLREVAVMLQLKVRRADELAARYGGEEFVVIAAGADAARALQLAEAIREEIAFARLKHPAAQAGIVTASIGVAVRVPQVGGSAADLVNAADQALYRAKESGRNRVEAAD